MTKEQYEVILGLLADKIKEQEKTIGLQKWQIERLENELKETEALYLSSTSRGVPAKKETHNKGVHNEIQN